MANVSRNSGGFRIFANWNVYRKITCKLNPITGDNRLTRVLNRPLTFTTANSLD